MIDYDFEDYSRKSLELTSIIDATVQFDYDWTSMDLIDKLRESFFTRHFTEIVLKIRKQLFVYQLFAIAQFEQPNLKI